MRKLVIALTLSTALLGGTCAYLLWRIGDAGSHLASNADTATQTRIDALVAERDKLRLKVAKGRLAEPCTQPAASTAFPSGSRIQPVGGSPAVARGGLGPAMAERLAPEHRRTLVRERYGVLFHELSLSEPQVDALMPVLAVQDERTRSPFEGFAALDPQEAQAREREIASVLGAEKSARFTELRRTMPARMEIRMLDMQLDQAGVPVSEEQKQRLIAAMKDLSLPEPPRPDAGAPPREGMERFRAWRAARAKLMRDAAAPILTATQLRRLDEHESLQAAMQAAMPPPSADL